MTKTVANMSSSIRHPDFEKIHSAFLSHYSKDPKLGESRYADWVKFSGLDESQSYYLQGAARTNKSKQSFEWATFLLQFVKEEDAYYYKVEALFPVESMNRDSPPFTREEVLQAARSLTGKPSDLNHDHKKMLEGVEVVAAQFKDDCVECLVRILKTSVLVGMIDRKEIINVSIEGEWSHGIPGHGLVLTGLGWLTKDTMLPGIPLTRIMPVERIAESFLAKKVLKEAVKQESDVYCVFFTPRTSRIRIRLGSGSLSISFRSQTNKFFLPFAYCARKSLARCLSLCCWSSCTAISNESTNVAYPT